MSVGTLSVKMGAIELTTNPTGLFGYMQKMKNYDFPLRVNYRVVVA